MRPIFSIPLASLLVAVTLSVLVPIDAANEPIEEVVFIETIEAQLEIEFHPNVELVFREGKWTKRVLLDGRAVDHGPEGQGRAFFAKLLKTEGEVIEMDVRFSDPVEVDAEPVPYMVPQVLGSPSEVSSRWSGPVESEPEWELHHLDHMTAGGERYSLKLYPEEYQNGHMVVYTRAEVSYKVTPSPIWSPNVQLSHKPYGPIKYLIITHEDLVESITPYAEWKSNKGLFTYIATTEEINDKYNSTPYIANKIRMFCMEMEAEYDLDYLLIVGDWDMVPSKLTRNAHAYTMLGEPRNYATDHYYGSVDQGTTWNTDGDTHVGEDGELDDPLMDMAVGRIALNNVTVIDQWVNEMLDREKNITYHSDVETAVIMAGDPGWNPGEPVDTCNYFWNTYGSTNFTSRETLYYDGSGTMSFGPEGFKEVLGQQYEAMSYFSHGEATEIPDLADNDDVKASPDNGTDGVFFAMACLTGWFDNPSQGSMGFYGDCFGETMTENPGRGTAGYMGASRLAVGAIDSTYSADAPGLEEDFWRIMNQSKWGDIDPTIGVLWQEAMANFVANFHPFPVDGSGNPGQRTFLEYNLLGDPDQPLVWREPEQLQLQFTVAPDNSSVWAKVTNATGVPVEGATVSICRFMELGRSNVTNASGECEIQIPMSNGGVINITAFRYGDRPDNGTFVLPDELEPFTLYKISPKLPDGNNDVYITLPKLTLYGDEPVDVEYYWDSDTPQMSSGNATTYAPEGVHTVHWRARDMMGFWSDWDQVTVEADLTAPGMSIITDPVVPDGTNGYFVTNPNVTIQFDEPVMNTVYWINGGTHSPYTDPISLAEGVWNVSFETYDIAGNYNTTNMTIVVDLTAPQSGMVLSHQPDGLNGWYKTPPVIRLQCFMGDDFPIYYWFDSEDPLLYDGNFTPPEGESTLYFYCEDQAGNDEQLHNKSFKLDTIAPLASYSVSPDVPDGTNGIYVSNPVVNITTNEGTRYYSLIALPSSGGTINWYEATDDVEVPEGHWELQVKAVDVAGNEMICEARQFKVDLTDPTLAFSVDPAKPDGENGWYVASPTVTASTTSINSTLEWREVGGTWTLFTDDIVVGDGNHTYEFRVTDEAGNTIAGTTDMLKVDLEVPGGIITTPQMGTFGMESILMEWTGFDDVSGVDHFEIKADSIPWTNVGLNTSYTIPPMQNDDQVLALKVYDKAGWSVMVTRTIHVDGIGPFIRGNTPTGTNIPVYASVRMTFSEEMAQQTVTVDLDGTEGNMTWDGVNLAFKPSEQLRYNWTYNVTVTGEDLYGNSMAIATWTFTTQLPPESGTTDGGSSGGSDLGWIAIPIVLGIIVIILLIVVAIVVVFMITRKKKPEEEEAADSIGSNDPSNLSSRNSQGEEEEGEEDDYDDMGIAALKMLKKDKGKDEAEKEEDSPEPDLPDETISEDDLEDLDLDPLESKDSSDLSDGYPQDDEEDVSFDEEEDEVSFDDDVEFDDEDDDLPDDDIDDLLDDDLFEPKGSSDLSARVPQDDDMDDIDLDDL